MKNLFLSFLVGMFFATLQAQNIQMTFHNGSLQSIPLVIPGVMNPNLSPLSDSGISLDVGQKIYFFPKGKRKSKEILFVVDNNIKKDSVLQIDEIIKKRKKELLEK
ncbi:MAG: hypothetical protein RIT03_464 [Bacteroidota bacterium]|jgi:hypothetical protein